ncbi:MAG: DUF4932 domain-containing protein [Myxococcaceae bacterium]|nr:DUF4932 domain-containing protein [Myxococcaceae bacterium]
MERVTGIGGIFFKAKNPALKRCLFLLAAATVFFGAACAHGPVATNPPTNLQMIARVDRRVETLAILMRLAGAKEFLGVANTDYLRDIDAYFAPYRRHAAVEATKQIREAAGIGFNAPFGLAVHLNEQFAPRVPLAPFPAHLDKRWAKVDIAAYLEKVQAFVVDTRADAFFEAHAGYFAKVEERYQPFVQSENAVAWFDAFFGARPQVRYLVVPGFLNGPSNYAAHVELTDGSEEMFQSLGLDDLDADGLPTLNASTVELLVHEMAHSYADPLVSERLDSLQKPFETIFPLVREKMARASYEEWPTVARESLTRAVTIAYLRDRKGADAAARQALDDADRGFYWTESLADRFQAYRQNPRNFLPQLTTFFEVLAAQYAEQGLPAVRFHGPINSAVSGDNVIIGPAGSAELQGYLKALQVKLKNTEPLLFDFDPSSQAIAGRGLILYGSPQTNRGVAKALELSGWRLEADRIVLPGVEVRGQGLVLIACRTLPGSVNRGLVIYASLRDEDVVGINSVFHGPNDWVIARRVGKKFEVVKTGDFPKGPSGPWNANVAW